MNVEMTQIGWILDSVLDLHKGDIIDRVPSCCQVIDLRDSFQSDLVWGRIAAIAAGFQSGAESA